MFKCEQCAFFHRFFVECFKKEADGEFVECHPNCRYFVEGEQGSVEDENCDE